MSVTRRKYNRYREKVTYEKPIFNKIKSDEQFYADLFEYWQVDINKPPKLVQSDMIFIDNEMRTKFFVNKLSERYGFKVHFSIPDENNVIECHIKGHSKQDLSVLTQFIIFILTYFRP